jgi:hypothetical protein
MPKPTRTRVEAVERAYLAVQAAAQALEGRPDDPEVQKTHALAEIAEVLALRREGYRSRDQYLHDVAPTFDDPALEARHEAARGELSAAQAEWDALKAMLVQGEPQATLDLTGDQPVIGLG